LLVEPTFREMIPFDTTNVNEDLQKPC